MRVEEAAVSSGAHFVVRAIVVLAVLGVLVPGTRADRLVFNPSVEVGRGYTDNITFQGTDTRSDQFGLLGFEIPIERETRRSYLRFQWRPTFVRYDDVSTLDFDDQRLDLNWRSDVSRRGDLNLRTSFVSTQQQGSPLEPDNPDLTLTQRTNREFYRLNVRYRHELSRRWAADVLLSGRALDYDPISGLDNAGNFQNRTDYGVRIGAARGLTQPTSVGGRYEYRRFDLDESNNGNIPGVKEDSHQFAATYTQNIARRLSLEAALGGYFNSVVDVTPNAAGIEAAPDESGVLAELFLTRTYKSFSARLDLFHRPSAGGARSGTAIETTVGFTFESDRDSRRKWIWLASPRVSRRESSISGRTIDNFGLRGDVERRLGYRFSIRLDADWFDQDTNDSVFRANLGFLWYPWGATQLGGRGG